MSRCEETAGILFRRARERAATTTCEICRRTVCDEHQRTRPDASAACITCLREELRRGGEAARTGWLRDDPWFFSSTHGGGLFSDGPAPAGAAALDREHDDDVDDDDEGDEDDDDDD